ncbi:25046_t:CDS:2, partial [Racocetra persica]
LFQDCDEGAETILHQSGPASFNEILTFNDDEAIRTREFITQNQNLKIEVKIDHVLKDDIYR